MRARERRLEQDVARALRLRRAQDAAVVAVLGGRATLTEYRLALKSGGVDVAADRRLLIPTLTVTRAARRNGVAAAPPALPMLALAREALSFPPGEEMPADLRARLDGIDEIWRDNGQDLQARLSAARARLLLGAADGFALRENIWNSGLAEEQALKVFADYEKWHVRELVHSWDPWLSEARRQELEDGREWHPDRKYLVPLEAIALLIDLQLWSQERPEPATTGQPDGVQ